jgi:hypothetical protein
VREGRVREGRARDAVACPRPDVSQAASKCGRASRCGAALVLAEPTRQAVSPKAQGPGRQKSRPGSRVWSVCYRRCRARAGVVLGRAEWGQARVGEPAVWAVCVAGAVATGRGAPGRRAAMPRSACRHRRFVRMRRRPRTTYAHAPPTCRHIAHLLAAGAALHQSASIIHLIHLPVVPGETSSQSGREWHIICSPRPHQQLSRWGE